MEDFRLKVFTSVAKNKSFTKASKELFISQPSVTKHIHELETHYETRLFERKGNSISLTEAGKVLLEHSKRILNNYEQMEYEMSLLRNNLNGELRIGASSTIAQYVLPPLLARFIEKFPKIKTSLISGNSEQIENALQENQIDVGLVEGNIRQQHLKYTPFMQDELVAVVSTKSRLSKYDELELKDLYRIPLILREQGSGTLDILTEALQKHHIRLKDLSIRMHLGNTESIKLFLENSDCMGFVSIRSINNEIYSGKFKILEINELSMDRTFYFSQRQGEEKGITALFMEFCQRYSQKL